jgi:N-acetylglucosaminyldiphosphoundecaprenol N-acetyl-beta-D-mannosaminyltransferase
VNPGVRTDETGDRSQPEKRTHPVEVLGTPIDATSYDHVLATLARHLGTDARSFAFCNVHSVMTARRDPAVRRALAEADIRTPDGMPLVWVLRRRGLPEQSRVYGPDLMELALRHGVGLGWRHFLLGAAPETLDRLADRARALAPGVCIVGTHSPPFRPMTAQEEAEVVAAIQASGANLVWIGLGMPKQELWMARARAQLPGVHLLAVGAAFDLISGTVPQAPDWMQDHGLEWAYRLWREPRRLWRRYLYNNPAFAVLATAEIILDRAHRRKRTRGLSM